MALVLQPGRLFAPSLVFFIVFVSRILLGFLFLGFLLPGFLRNIDLSLPALPQSAIFYQQDFCLRRVTSQTDIQ